MAKRNFNYAPYESLIQKPMWINFKKSWTHFEKFNTPRYISGWNSHDISKLDQRPFPHKWNAQCCKWPNLFVIYVNWRVFQSQDPGRWIGQLTGTNRFPRNAGMIKEPLRRERIYAGFNGTVKENSQRERTVEGGKILSERTSLRARPCLLSFLTNETIKHAVLAYLSSRAISFSLVRSQNLSHGLPLSLFQTFYLSLYVSPRSRLGERK